MYKISPTLVYCIKKVHLQKMILSPVKRNDLAYRPVRIVSTLPFDRQLQVAVKAVQNRLVIGLIAISRIAGRRIVAKCRVIVRTLCSLGARPRTGRTLWRQVVACRILSTYWYLACLVLSNYFCCDVLRLRDGLMRDLTVFQTVVRGRRGGQSGWHLVSGIGTTAPIADFLLRLFLLLLLLLQLLCCVVEV